MTEVEFIYNGAQTIIQCKADDIMKEICKMFAIKSQMENEKNLIFLYDGNIIKENLTFIEQANNSDKERNKMSVIVFKDVKDEHDTITKLKQIVCPECKESTRIRINNYKFNFFECKNGHSKRNILFKEYPTTQEIDQSKIKCDICKINNKGNSYNNIFYICFHCKVNLCPLCKSNHDKSHNIINYDDKYFICDIHNELYNSYCSICKKNICLLCEKEHFNHNIINYSMILPDKEAKLNEIRIFKMYIDIFKKEIESIINQLRLLAKMVNEFYYINNIIINNYDVKKRNYQILQNINDLNIKSFINDINKIYLSQNKVDKFEKMIELYNNIITTDFEKSNKYINNMKEKKKNENNINIILEDPKRILTENIKKNNEITITYKLEDNKKIKIFGKQFVQNNKDNCHFYFQGKYYILNEYFYIGDNSSSEDIIIEEGKSYFQTSRTKFFKIKLIGINNISDMSYMFNECSYLEKLTNLENWDINKVINMKSLFFGCSSIKELPDISEWDTSNVTDMSQMFTGCFCLGKIPNICKWNTSNVTDMSQMFSNCSNLESLPNISEWNINNVVNISSMFNRCTKLKEIDNISKWNISRVIDISSLFCECIQIDNIPDISNWQTENVIDMSNIFKGCKKISRLPDLSKWNTKNVIYMNSMFADCFRLKTLPDISKWNISNVIDISSMFENCYDLFSLPCISLWNTNSIINMRSLFMNCKDLHKIEDLSKWNTNNVSDISFMFYNCLSLVKLPDMSNWNTEKLKYMNSLFENCSSVSSLPDISKWNIKHVKDMSYIFSNCLNITTLPDISNWRTYNVIYMNSIFRNCRKLTELPDISKWRTNNVINMNNLFSLNTSIEDYNVVHGQIEIKYESEPNKPKKKYYY